MYQSIHISYLYQTNNKSLQIGYLPKHRYQLDNYTRYERYAKYEDIKYILISRISHPLQVGVWRLQMPNLPNKWWNCEESRALVKISFGWVSEGRYARTIN